MSVPHVQRLPLFIVAAFIAATIWSIPMPALSQKAPVDAARLATARELMAASGAAKNLDSMIPLLSQQITNMLISQKPQQKAAIEQVMKEGINKMLERKQELIDDVAVIYAARLTSEEMSGLLTFYKSPTGQKFLAVQPDIMKESMAAGQAWGMKIGAEMDRMARDELKKRGIDL
jgi:uncharacterized protein